MKINGSSQKRSQEGLVNHKNGAGGDGQMTEKEVKSDRGGGRGGGRGGEWKR